MDGIIVIDKPKNYTSHDIVNIARRTLKTKRVGHIGTLDPNATGVLVLCVNKATKLVKFFENHSKTYIATIKLGVQTDTDDLTGEIINQKSTESITDEQIKEAVNSFKGLQHQLPPNYSAIKVNGKKMYELARKNKPMPELKTRPIEVLKISNLTVLSRTDGIIIEVTLKVSKGTYIRSIARDLGFKLDNFGTLKELRRTDIELFSLKDSISLEEFEKGNYNLLDPFQFLGMNEITIEDKYLSYIDNGRFLDIKLFPDKSNTVIKSSNGDILAIYRYDEQKNTMRMSVKWC